MSTEIIQEYELQKQKEMKIVNLIVLEIFKQLKRSKESLEFYENEEKENVKQIDSDRRKINEKYLPALESLTSAYSLFSAIEILEKNNFSKNDINEVFRQAMGKIEFTVNL